MVWPSFVPTAEIENNFLPSLRLLQIITTFDRRRLFFII